MLFFSLYNKHLQCIKCRDEKNSIHIGLSVNLSARPIQEIKVNSCTQRLPSLLNDSITDQYTLHFIIWLLNT